MTPVETLAAHRHVRLGDTCPAPSGCWCGFGITTDETPLGWAAHALDALAAAGYAVVEMPAITTSPEQSPKEKN